MFSEKDRKLLVYPPIYRLGLLGKWIRNFLMSGILQGTPVLLQIQGFRFNGLNKLMTSVSYLGEEEFYTLLLVSLLWIFSSKLGRLLAFVMSIGFWFSGFFKNLLCLPRPPSPPVKPLAHCSDWAFPSHHSVLNVAVPWYIWLYVYVQCDWSGLSITSLLAMISFWSFSIMFSRLYLGVHSPADVLAGGIMGCVILIVWLLVDEYVETHLQSGQFILLLFTAALFGISIYPDPNPPSIVIVETIHCICSSFGINVGYYVNSFLKTSSVAIFEESSEVNDLKLLYQIPVRVLLGGISLLVLKFFLEKTASLLLTSLLALFGIPSCRVKRRSAVTAEKVHYSEYFEVVNKVCMCVIVDKINCFIVLNCLLQLEEKGSPNGVVNVDLAVRFITFTGIGFGAAFLIPTLFKLLLL